MTNLMNLEKDLIEFGVSEEDALEIWILEGQYNELCEGIVEEYPLKYDLYCKQARRYYQEKIDTILSMYENNKELREILKYHEV